MARYRTKPVVVEACLWDGVLVGEPDGTGAAIGFTCPSWLPAVIPSRGLGATVEAGEIASAGNELLIGTLEGTMRASPGDFIIFGTRGELYPCKPDVFATKYQPENPS